MGKVKSDLNELKERSSLFGDSMDMSTAKARGGMMLLENVTGVRVPRALNSLIASIPAVSVAFSALLPIVGVVVAIEIIDKLIRKHKEMKEKIQDSQTSLGTTIAQVFTGLDDKLLEAGIRADEFTGNHLGALHKELLLLDHASLRQLSEQFDHLAKQADLAFATMKASWYELGSGSTGAQHTLATFKTHYDSLIAAGKTAEASDFLGKTLEREEKILALQKQAKDSQASPDTGKQGNYEKYVQAKTALEGMKAGWTDKEIEAQETITDVLKAQGVVEQKNAALKAADAKLDHNKAAKASATDIANVDKIRAERTLAIEDAQRKLNATIAEGDAIANRPVRATSDPGKQLAEAEKLAGEQYDIAVSKAQDTLKEKERINADEVKAAAGNGPKLAELAEKLKSDRVATENALNQELADLYKKDVEAQSTFNREKLTQSEESIKQIVESASKAGQQELRLATERAHGEEEISKSQFAQMAEGINAAVQHETVSQRQATAMRISLIQSELKAKVAGLIAEEAAKKAALEKEIKAEEEAANSQLKANGGDKADPTYLKYLDDVAAKKREIAALEGKLSADTKTANTQAVTAINQQKSALTGLQDTMKKVQGQFNQDFAKMVVEGKSFGKSMRQLTIQMLEQWIEYEMKSLERTAMTSIMKTTVKTTEKATDVATTATAEAAKASIEEAANAKSRLGDAKKGAVKAYNAFADIPVVGPALGAAAAVGAFGFLMAFQNGGTVPGTGSGDTVPAMLSPGETVVSKALTDQVKNNTGGSSKGDTHNHLTYSPHVTAIDANGVESMLKKHANVFQKHVASTMRKQGKRAS